MRRLSPPGGFGLTELVVAMVLAAVVGTSAIRLLLVQQRAARATEHRLRLNATFRMISGFLPVELREVSTDGAVADLLAITPGSMAYRAPRGLLFLCQSATRGAGRLVLRADRVFGLRAADPERDSLLLFVEGDQTTPADDGWGRADLLAVAPATCPDGRAGIEFRISGAPDSLAAGAPVRPFEPTELRLYRDRTGERWLGLRTARKAGGWTVTQPVVGPLGVDGMVVVGRDAAGGVTTAPGEVASVAAAFAGPSEAPFPLEMVVALRNGVR